MIKRKFGDSVRSKTDIANRDEVLAKALCHKRVVVIHEMRSRGSIPGSRRVAEEPTAAITKSPGA